MQAKPWVCALLTAVLGAPLAVAQSNSDTDRRIQQLETELRQTRSQLNEVVQELHELKRQMSSPGAGVATTTPAPVPPAANPNDYTAATPPPAQSVVESHPAATLDALRQNQELLAAQVEEQHQTKVESSSRYRVKLSGLILLNAFSNSGGVDIPDLPNRAVSTVKTGIGASIRQTVLGLQVFGPTVGGAATSGDISVDFFGGFPQAPYGTTAGVLRLRRGSVRFDWKNNSVVAGQEAPFFSPLSPTSFATVAEPALSWAGNLWVWTPQVVAEHRFHSTENSWFSIEGGLMLPLTEDIPDTVQYNGIDAGQRSRRPAVATNFGWNSTLFGQPLQLGAGAYNSHLKYEFGRETDAWAATGYWRLPLGDRFEFSGEGYRGHAVGGLGGGVWQSVAYNGDPNLSSTQQRPLGSMGGWSQLKFRATPKVELNSAMGQDNVLASDTRWAPMLRNEFSGRLTARNREAFGNVIYHPRSNLVLSLEYRHIWTWPVGIAVRTADHVNLGAGITF